MFTKPAIYSLVVGELIYCLYCLLVIVKIVSFVPKVESRFFPARDRGLINEYSFRVTHNLKRNEQLYVTQKTKWPKRKSQRRDNFETPLAGDHLSRVHQPSSKGYCVSSFIVFIQTHFHIHNSFPYSVGHSHSLNNFTNGLVTFKNEIIL